jgi:hypothetical protein
MVSDRFRVSIGSLCALRFAARGPAAQGRVFFLSLPSAYPFSAQARLGPHWANLGSRLPALGVSQGLRFRRGRPP